jgi:ABC-type histidine transport system ATPase subunit
MTALQTISAAPIKVLGKSKDDAPAQARDLLARVGLSDKVDAYPAFLSGGRQHASALRGHSR